MHAIEVALRDVVVVVAIRRGVTDQEASEVALRVSIRIRQFLLPDELCQHWNVVTRVRFAREDKLAVLKLRVARKDALEDC